MNKTLSTMPVDLFNTLQRTACSIGTKKPIFCQCFGLASCNYYDEESEEEGDELSPALSECEGCDRLVPWCFMGYESELCDHCWAKQKRN